MPVVHFLNVKEGDCSVIQHGASGHVSVVDVFNASKPDPAAAILDALYKIAAIPAPGPGNFNQKAHPVNPIEYLQERSLRSIFRYIQTHPDMDHMGGIKDFFEVFQPGNFWDTDNNKEMVFEEGSPHNEDDWKFYKALRDGNPQENPKRLTLYSGAKNKYWNEDDEGKGGDYLHVLAPTPALVKEANETGDYNDCSYVLLYRAHGGKVVFSGDSHDKTWDHILDTHGDAVANTDVLIAPHHGRKSKRSYKFLDVVNPTLTFFGNAPSEHLAYDAWRNRGLPYVTNNQANCMIVDGGEKPMRLYVTHEAFAKKVNPGTYWSDTYKAYYCYEITRD